MDQLIDAIQNLVPHKYQPLALAVAVLMPRGLYALKNGGGLREFLMAMFLGTNTPATPPAIPGNTTSTPAAKIPILLAMLGCLALGTAGCSTTQQGVVYKSASAVQTALDGTMTIYGDYLKIHPLPDATRAKVRDAYIKVEAALTVVVDAEIALGTATAQNSPSATVTAAQGQQTAALAQASQALSDLVALVRSFGVKI